MSSTGNALGLIACIAIGVFIGHKLHKWIGEPPMVRAVPSTSSAS